MGNGDGLEIKMEREAMEGKWRKAEVRSQNA